MRFTDNDHVLTRYIRSIMAPVQLLWICDYVYATTYINVVFSGRGINLHCKFYTTRACYVREDKVKLIVVQIFTLTLRVRRHSVCWSICRSAGDNEKTNEPGGARRRRGELFLCGPR